MRSAIPILLILITPCAVLAKKSPPRNDAPNQPLRQIWISANLNTLHTSKSCPCKTYPIGSTIGCGSQKPSPTSAYQSFACPFDNLPLKVETHTQ